MLVNVLFNLQRERGVRIYAVIYLVAENIGLGRAAVPGDVGRVRDCRGHSLHNHEHCLVADISSTIPMISVDLTR